MAITRLKMSLSSFNEQAHTEYKSRDATNQCCQEETMQPNVLVAYATRAGSTEEVAQTLAEVLRSRDLAVDVRPATDVNSVETYSAVVIAVALYMGKMHKDVRRFLSMHRIALTKTPVALFVLGPVQKEEKDWIGAQKQLDEELRNFPWLSPVDQHIVGGRFDPAKLGFPFNLIPAMRKMPASDALDWNLIREQANGLAERFL
jgi:menaquinone-dependent protoporphyrinogen oxidase